jgi:hypothetical protein
VLLLQETHVRDEEQLNNRCRLPGYSLAGATFHDKYGLATYVKDEVQWTPRSALDGDVYVVRTIVEGIVISNIYKPPNAAWPTPPLPAPSHPAILIGDFNSHHTTWGYNVSDKNGEDLTQWAELNDLHLVHDAKQKGTFHSARWNRDYNPDLCFVTRNGEGKPISAVRKVLGNFPHSQHRPVVFTIGLYIQRITSIPKNRWNFSKANWVDFSRSADDTLRWFTPTVDNYERFVGAVIGAAKKYIPRGHRASYIPGWTAECEELYARYQLSRNQQDADTLINLIDRSRKEKWAQLVENTNFQHSSRKAWRLLRRLGSDGEPSNQKKNISPNQIANHIVETSRAPADKQFSKSVRRKFLQAKKASPNQSAHATPFTRMEMDVAISKIKPGKAAGVDEIFPEFIKNSGERTREWLRLMFNNILNTGRLPNLFKKSKVIAILKPGKPGDRPEGYRPISLLCVCYKLLERLIYNRIAPIIESVIPIEQAGFRPERGCVDQITALTTYIENGFQNKQKTVTVFVDLSAAYDTVWRVGLLSKFIQVIPCRTLSHLLNEMLSDRLFTVHLGNSHSSQRRLNNGLPQGSVLAPILFNLYTSDLPDTVSRKFIYADDIAVATQHTDFRAAENVLTEDLRSITTYLRQWRLKPNAQKTIVTCFHLSNKLANHQPHVEFDGRILEMDQTPKYLGVTLDTQLTYRKHIENTKAKIKTRNNIIHKLAGSTWGASAPTLRTSALALVYSAAEYAAPVWANSSHTHKVDAELNNTMRLITGAVRSTPTEWLPVLSNIPPPPIRRLQATNREWVKYRRNQSLPLHRDVPIPFNPRLPSRRPAHATASHLMEEDFNGQLQWGEEWRDSNRDTRGLMQEVGLPVPGFDLPRRQWVALNRIRTGHGRCGQMLHRRQIRASPACDCGEPMQSIQHIAETCPLRAFPGTYSDLHNATPNALQWLDSLDIAL